MPTIQLRDTTGALRTAKAITIRDASKTLQTVKRIYIRDASNTLRLVYNYFTAAASPTSVTGSGNSIGAITISTVPSTATATGGAGPFTYAWAKTSGVAGWSAVSPTGQSTSFRCTGIGAGSSQSSTWTCTITDATASTAVTNTVSATVTNTNTS